MAGKRLITAVICVLFMAVLLLPSAVAATLNFVAGPEEDGWWNSYFADDAKGSNGNSWRAENGYLINDIYGGCIRSPKIKIDPSKPFKLSVKIEVGDDSNGFVFLANAGKDQKPYDSNVFSAWLKFNQANFAANEWYMTNLYTPEFPSGVVAGENRGVSDTGGNPPKIVVCALEYDGAEHWFRMYDQTGKGAPLLSEKIEKNAPYTEGHPWGDFSDISHVFVWAEGSMKPVKILDYSFANLSAGGSAKTGDGIWLFAALALVAIAGCSALLITNKREQP